MKRLITFIFIIVLSFILFIGCDKSQKNLDAFKTENDNLRAQLSSGKVIALLYQMKMISLNPIMISYR